MKRELYVYFKAPASHAAAVMSAVTDMQSRLRSEVPGLQARLLKRIDAANGLHTWMETYTSADGVGEALGSTIEQWAVAWSDLLEGPRHTEVFDACA